MTEAAETLTAIQNMWPVYVALLSVVGFLGVLTWKSAGLMTAVTDNSKASTAAWTGLAERQAEVYKDQKQVQERLVSGLEKELKEEKQERVALEERLTERVVELEKDVLAKQKEIRDLQIESRDLKGQLEQRDRRISELTDRLTVVEADRKKVAEEREELKRENAELKDEIGKLEKRLGAVEEKANGKKEDAK